MLDRFSNVVWRLYRASHEMSMAAFQDHAFECLQAAIPFDSGLWITGVLHADRDAATFHTRHLYRQPLQLLSDWAQCKDAAIFSRKVFSSPGNSLTCTPSTDMGPELAAHARRYKIEQILATAQVEPIVGVHELISLYREDVACPFREQERLFQQSLVPHLSETWRLCRIRHLAHLGRPARAFNAHVAGADIQGVLCLPDPNFTRLLCEEWPDWRGPRLPPELFARFGGNELRYDGQRTVIRMIHLDDHVLLRGRRKLPVDGLSRREFQVAAEYATGRSNKEIAQSLRLSPATVRNHLSAVYHKLGIDNKATLAAIIRESE